ncbi:DMT family transporter [Undibacter mobilis]|uniref:DMT family transporter n=1 Tax=Undibacter mobilis TaxID=2292256 RepID=A0A371BCR7_9BRAD|nr:DMT family transporter [Undibacter mobilis]RDV05350.1 DMT family transporter [Undibacter mobilis]
MANEPIPMHRKDWLLLIALSVLWGGSFFFNGLALRELPPLTVAFARVLFGALCLLIVLKPLGGSLPKRAVDWLPFAVMGLVNNVIPFSLFLTAQTTISSGLASVLNATTPLFAVSVMALTGEERLTGRRLAGVLIGIGGVAVLRGPGLSAESQTIGIVLCLGAALSYGFAGYWGRHAMAGVPPLTSATAQLICSTPVMAVIAGAVERPWTLPLPGPTTWLAIAGLATLSTALAYILFFRILNRSGAVNVVLVTLLIPVTAILLGVWILNEPLSANEVAGALIIAASLIVIDGRAFAWLRQRYRRP